MNPVVEVSSMALLEISSHYAWLARRSERAANQWRAGLVAAIYSLRTGPERCPLAHENEFYEGELRQLLHGKRPNVWRVLSEIMDDSVFVIRVRHGAQELLGPDDF